eukprot:TRINITY_DN33041_c1_g4_i1.p1 TRINITY_DN33041_c1_g4~~TRINITY_DN33041_c1_g4_i1.p1  ORF type:complete len:352 (-),score=77.11 TRINITY_DN33041_c1_g4_i1:306-1361(-)
MNGNSVQGEVPSNANEHCPGTGAEMAGKSAACQGCPNQAACATAPKGPDPDIVLIQQRLAGVKNIILVLSGKGGVGKSTISTQLAFSLAGKELEVGLLDVDICGPSVPRMLGLQGEEVHQSNAGWSPVYVEDNLGVMSIGFMLPDPDEAVVWRGPRKNGIIKQFLKDVDWGELDILIIDTPPGTSDEHISIAQLLKGCNLAGAVLVTTPQEIAVMDVRKEVNFCVKVGIPILGIVENMSGLESQLSEISITDDTGNDVTDSILQKLKQTIGQEEFDKLSVQIDVFNKDMGGGEMLAKRYGLNLLGKVPLDPSIGNIAENGKGVTATLGANSRSVIALNKIVDGIRQKLSIG